MTRNFIKKYASLASILAIATLAANVAAQPVLAKKEQEIVDGSGDRMFYTVLFIVISCLAVAFMLWMRSKKGAGKPVIADGNRYANYYNRDNYENDGVDAAKELEWFRKARKTPAKAAPTKLSFDMKRGGIPRTPKTAAAKTNGSNLDADTRQFQEQMRKMQYAQLPINSFGDLTPSKTFEVLPVSDDPSLLNAIEQANEEFEEDESVRELSVRILTAFKTRNSVEALSQIAIYDLSAPLRSKAVAILTDFDHPSVFEAILLACADPTREVRATAARGLFRLNFDRADAWKRIIETQDEFRMRHAARAAIEAGIAGKACERLVHEDLKVSYESYALVALLIKSGEIDELFEAIRSHKDERVKFAVLHALRSVRDDRSLAGLKNLQMTNTFSADVSERISDTIRKLENMPHAAEAAWLSKR